MENKPNFAPQNVLFIIGGISICLLIWSIISIFSLNSSPYLIEGEYKSLIRFTTICGINIIAAIFIVILCDIFTFKFKKTTKIISCIKLLLITLLAIGTLIVLIKGLNTFNGAFQNISVYLNFETLQNKMFVEQAQNVLKISFLAIILFVIFSFYYTIKNILILKNSTKQQTIQQND